MAINITVEFPFSNTFPPKERSKKRRQGNKQTAAMIMANRNRTEETILNHPNISVLTTRELLDSPLLGLPASIFNNF